MNFDQDYIEFIEHLKKGTTLASPVLIRVEDAAVRLFVAYLNCRYADISNKRNK